MQRLEVSGAVRPIYGSLGVKRLKEEIRLLTRHKVKLKASVTPEVALKAQSVSIRGDCLPVHAKQSTPYGTGSNLDQERADVVKQELIVAGINTCIFIIKTHKVYYYILI